MDYKATLVKAESLAETMGVGSTGTLASRAG